MGGDGMKCPHCRVVASAGDFVVIDSRDDNNREFPTARTRRRGCPKCFRRFTTFEVPLAELSQWKAGWTKGQREVEAKLEEANKKIAAFKEVFALLGEGVTTSGGAK
jgi:transcriptional regulator NrdR family protein